MTDSLSHPAPSYSPGRLLLFLFLLSLPLINPWIRGDGVGYYALARAPLIEHSLDFSHDYQYANARFRGARVDEHGEVRPTFRTPTGHLDNHFTVGPAILWTPFLLLAHLSVLIARAFGSAVPADGFSAPYRFAMAFATGLYGFLGLLLSFRLARKYVSETWALLATIAIWWASSLPVYMYFNPSWSHAHSAFVVALFLWYWHETRPARTLSQWLLLALIAGLTLNVYYANAMLLAVLAGEAFPQYRAAFRRTPAVPAPATTPAPAPPSLGALVLRHFLFCAVVLASLLPTFLTRTIIYGSPFASGYIPLSHWLWRSPVFFQVLFSSNHGLFAWTPIILLSFFGLLLFARRHPAVGFPFLAAVLAFYLFICCYPDWAGISSFGNRFFISLTPLFILGLAVFLDALSHLFPARRTALLLSSALLACFILWNLAFMFQWGTHLVPARGPIDFPQMARNQFTVVPSAISSQLRAYLFGRHDLMRQIEDRDQPQPKPSPPQY
ncbi:MAG TPA: hypothetical protein VOA78_06525 [Candidatus Dormibacteraeota bacterium]|nr:hypothetical protein [Candidatus Dormibacteraeota bacterium]